MKPADELKKEIEQLYVAIEKTKSPYLKRDYLKAINRKKKNLKEYYKSKDKTER